MPLLVMTSGYRSRPTTIARTTGTDRCGRPIGRCRLACVRAGCALLVHIDTGNVLTSIAGMHWFVLVPPPGQGGIQILAAVVPRIQEQNVAVVVGYALVIMQFKFQQSFLFMFLHVCLRFVPDIPVVCRDGYAQCKTAQNTVETSQVQGMVVGVPVN